MHAAAGTYTGTWFHRVLPGFMAQAGDPAGTGKGGEAALGGFVRDEYTEALGHSGRGVVSMAKPRGAKDENGSQFFVTFSAQPHLDGAFTVVGVVLGSAKALDALESCPVTRKGRPATEADRVTIRSVVVHANPFAAAAT